MRLQVPCSRFLALAAFALLAFADPFAGHAHETISTSTASTEVCESKTINYITHTLPQQCLRTNWSSANSTDQNATTIATDTAIQTPVVETASETGHAAPVETGATHGGTAGKEEDTAAEDKEAKAKAKAAEDDDEDLATSSFMSFEEWKAMMLKKAGQDPADLKERRRREGLERAELGPHDVLDSWGDDGEIALDFDVLSGKISDMTATASAKTGEASGDASNNEDKVPAPPLDDDGVARYRRPKDAGKTCKERFSYSSFDGGATILKTSPGAQNPKSILVENKDAYMLFTCSQENKFVIVELSEDVLVDTVVLANFEFFSSTIRHFRVSVSDKYPVKLEKWKDIGTYQARNTRDIQAFLIENPKIWAKYIRIEFLSHYGKEYYCPVSLLRVHGTRMLDTWKDVENAVPDDDETDESAYELEAVPEPELPEPPPVAQPEATHIAASTVPFAANDSIRAYGISPRYPPLYKEPQLETCSIITPTTTGTATMELPIHAANDSQRSMESVSSSNMGQPGPTVHNITVSSTAVVSPSSTTSLSPAYTSTNTSTTAASQMPDSTDNVYGNSSQAAEQAMRSSVTPPKPPAGTKSDDAPNKPTSKYPHTTHQHKNVTGTTSSAAASPTIQESFFKSITKRITYLEGNMTLSLQYIEEQSKFLQDSLQKMERRQISRIDNFLSKLNNTVFDELRSVKAQYDQHWQSTVLELESQREHFDRQIITLTMRVNLLADEVGFLKLMMIVLIILQVCCLVVVLFPRGPPGGEQWTTTGQFFNTYLGSPRLPPGSPQSVRNGNLTPTHQRRMGRYAISGPLRPGVMQRSVSGPPAASFKDKVLPLTPTSERSEPFDRSDNENDSPTPPSSRAPRSPPQIRVNEPEDLFDDDDDDDDDDNNDDDSNDNDDDEVDKRARPLIEELPSPGEESSGSITPSSRSSRKVAPEQKGDQVYDDEDDGESNKPPLTRSPFSELGASSRKPLPALPEDPVS
ncbi:hypothetical protein N0V93_004937 [Gnomoniopsis smithogilvyi]|uniref:SUN domain-containing protein n=1 Tax=Gnomoniopsis smithogilvyi TaxID=1191159 RepID=A0A9W8YTL2_9PEZI|nr:hypothetical protein N0V93_004937 [Gnomoniopsis smithogilvyi]